jgi:hypothetical protein
MDEAARLDIIISFYYLPPKRSHFFVQGISVRRPVFLGIAKTDEK